MSEVYHDPSDVRAMKLFRYRRPSLNTLLGVTKAKKQIKRSWASPRP